MLRNNVTLDNGKVSEYHALADVLTRAKGQTAMEIATDTRSMSRNSGNIVNLRRWTNPAVDTTTNNTGLSKASRALTHYDYTGTMGRFTESFDVARYEYDLSQYNPVRGATDVLGDYLIPETREMVRYGAAKTITTILYNSVAVGGRGSVNGVLGLGQIQKAVRGIENYRGMKFRGAEAGKAADGTSPVEAAYFAFGHTDLAVDIRNIPGFKPVSEYPSGKGASPYEFGAIQNVRIFLSPAFVPYANAGAASTTLISTGVTGTSSGSADVYPFIILAQGALTGVKLEGSGKEGFGNAKINILDKPDKSDVNNDRVVVAADWYDLCVVTSNEWGCVIEVGATRNPS